MANVVYVGKSELGPYFGRASRATGTAYVRDDLPRCVQKFVEAHELRHLKQSGSDHWVINEIDATLALDWKLFPGFVVAFFMNFTPERLALIWKRIRGVNG